MFLKKYRYPVRFAGAAIILALWLAMAASWKLGNRATMPTRFRGAADTERLANPFRLDGCIFLHGVMEDPQKPCPPRPALAGAESALALIGAYVQPDNGKTPNVVSINHGARLATPVKQGRHIALTLDQYANNVAQAFTDCAVGASASCPDGFDRRPVNMFPAGARASRAGLLLLDATTGGILAAASSYSACVQGKSAACPALPVVRPAIRYFDNLALYVPYRPGSVTKVLVAIGLMNSKKYPLTKAELNSLQTLLVHSDTLALINLVMCEQYAFSTPCIHDRLDAVWASAAQIGWNGPATDLLTAGTQPTLGQPVITANFLAGDEAPSIRYPSLPVAQLRECAQRKHRLQRWRRCHGTAVAAIANEMWAGSDATATLPALGNLMLALTSAANAASPSARQPLSHLVNWVQDGSGQAIPVQALRQPVTTPDAARFLLDALSQGHVRGSSNGACNVARQGARASGLLWSIDCNGTAGTLHVAGKTGTPRASVEQPLPSLKRECDSLHAAYREKRASLAPDQLNKLHQCAQPPLKLYMAALGGQSGHFNRIVIVAIERAYQESGEVDDADDSINFAAVIGLSLGNVLYGQARSPDQPEAP